MAFWKLILSPKSLTINASFKPFHVVFLLCVLFILNPTSNLILTNNVECGENYEITQQTLSQIKYDKILISHSCDFIPFTFVPVLVAGFLPFCRVFGTFTVLPAPSRSFLCLCAWPCFVCSFLGHWYFNFYLLLFMSVFNWWQILIEQNAPEATLVLLQRI